MTIYLLDTNIASHLIKGDLPGVRRRLQAVPIHSVAVSVITQAELLFGVAKRGHPAGLSALVREFLLRVDVLPWTSEAATAYADLCTQCEAAGLPLAPMDMMIAAHAKALSINSENNGAILVTRDRAFSRIPGGMRLEDWTTEAKP